MTFPINPSPGDSYTDAYGTVWVYAGTVNGWYRQIVSTQNDTTYTSAISGPAGSNTQVQFNDNGELAGDSGLTYNKTTDALSGGAFIPTGSTVPTNGLYRPSANNVAISTGGSGKLFVDANGNVGIGGATDKTQGVTSSGKGLTVQATGAPTISIWDNNNAANYTNHTQLGASNYIWNLANGPIIFGTNNTERLRITSAGLVGIGTSSPGALLDVSGAGNIVRLGDGTNTFDVRFRGPNNWAVQLDTSTDVFNIQRNSTPFVNIDGAGRVGIGTASLNAKLVVSTNNENFEFSPASTTFNGGVLEYLNRNTNTTRPDLNYYLGSTTGGSHKFWTDGTERARIDSSGRLLVGTSSDSGGALLQVNGDRIRVGTAKTPASATATGTTGEICWDASYVYVCTATNTWKRSALSTW